MPRGKIVSNRTQLFTHNMKEFGVEKALELIIQEEVQKDREKIIDDILKLPFFALSGGTFIATGRIKNYAQAHDIVLISHNHE